MDFVNKNIFSRKIDRVRENRNYNRLPDEDREEVDREIEELRQDWLKEVELTKKQFNELLLTMGIQLKPMELNSIFDAFDVNHDAVITLTEFLDFCGPKREKRGGSSMILNQRCCWLTTCKITGMANGYSISNPTKRLLKNQEEASQKEKHSNLLTKFYKQDERKDNNDDDHVAEEENYKLNHMKFTGKAVMRKLANGEVRVCIELNERQKREDLLRKMGLLESFQKQKHDSKKSGKRADKDDYEDDYEKDEEERYSDDNDHDGDKDRGKADKNRKNSKLGGTTSSEVSVEPCDFSIWSLKDRKDGLRYLLSITKDAREEELLKTMISNGKPPNAPKFWVDTRKQAKNLGTNRRSPTSYDEEDKEEEEKDNYDEMLTDEDLTTSLNLHWTPQEPNELVSFYSIEYGGAVTSTVVKNKSYDTNKYIEIYRDPEDADINKTFNFCYRLKDLSPGTSYRFRIRAFNGFGPSDYTYKTFTTITTAPLEPKVTKLTSDSVTFRWTFSKEFFQRMEELKKIFQLADKDRSGSVDREELTAIFDDKVTDSKLLQSFLHQIAASKELDLSQGYGALFDLMETDDDGGLSWTEFENFFMSAGWTVGGGGGGGSTTNVNNASTANQSLKSSNTTAGASSTTTTIRPGDIVYVVEKCESEFDEVYKEVLRTTHGVATITRLEPGNSYRFRVYSLNVDEIPGPRSPDVVVHTLLETPQAPAAVTATPGNPNKPIKNRSILITWRPRNYITSTRSASFVSRMVGDWAHSTGNNDGGVSIESVFAQYDKDRSGTIDRKELVAVLEDLGVAVTQERLNHAFSELDVNNDGEVTFDEFSKWWRADAVTYTLKRSEEIQPRNRFVGGTLNNNEESSNNRSTSRGHQRRPSSSGANLNESRMSAIPEENSQNISKTMRMTASRAGSVHNEKNPHRFGRQVGVPIVVYRDAKTRYDVKGLTPNSLYHFKVRYVGSRSNSVLSPPLVIMTAPNQPSTPALIDVSCNSVRVKWYPGEYGAYKFIVQMRPFQQAIQNNTLVSSTGRTRAATLIGVDTGDDGWIQVYYGPDNFYTNTTLSTEFPYELRVFAVNYQGVFSEPSDSLVFSTLSRNDTSGVINSKTVSSLFHVECTGDICVGDTVLITERLFLRPKGSSGAYLDEKNGVLGTPVMPKENSTTMRKGGAATKPSRPSSAGATNRNNPLNQSVTSLHTTVTVGENDGFISINPSTNAQFIGERTFAAIITKDNYRTTRDVLENKNIHLRNNYKEFSAHRKLWLEIIWSKSSTDLAKKYELKNGEILERFQNHLELFEVFRCPWKQEAMRKSLPQEWECLKDCFIDRAERNRIINERY
jgi:Ca2+-binding EF-hand superfamily protein